jgi:hypothetical protein
VELLDFVYSNFEKHELLDRYPSPYHSIIRASVEERGLRDVKVTTTFKNAEFSINNNFDIYGLNHVVDGVA